MSKMKITLEDLFDIPSAVILNPDSYKPASDVVIDSRIAGKNSIFFAIKGEKLDGHDFVREAVKKGAHAVVINKNKLRRFDNIDITIVTVEDTTKAYGDLAGMRRNKLRAIVIGITGSNGKTTTKEMTATLLAEKYKVEKTVSNNNNHIGVPLTILSAHSDCQALVLEQGTNHFGEIPYSASISRPDIALITNIGDSHLEFLKNREGVYKEKSALFDVAEIVLINSDDPVIKKNTKHYDNKVTFGFKGDPDVKGKIEGYTPEGKTRITVSSGRTKISLTLPVYGQANAMDFLSACVIALNMDLTKKQISAGAKKIKAFDKRLQACEYKNAILIDDTYNANPSSMRMAFDVVKHISLFRNKVLILGDMFELGNTSAKMHAGLAAGIPDSRNYTVLTLGREMKNLHNALKNKKTNSVHFMNREALKKFLAEKFLGDSAILVKGSRGMQMEEFVKLIGNKFE